ncbi:Protein of unknown function [Desulfotomaculum arcticum]|uniref:DUF3298 domain-containing protein n=1 Tax=Desulfotruncus arcticus DSM 17038 TaxID=1121424 RepID=A0A1I2V3X5_9FIRM|nr:DUF3298 domain-containing protein [Desulfotruncus arcticus]SFG84104.1 Protein of unknown function [Desulfotomaculum arcticum] [Desulfotruncus arcticus DSM 17038]
MPNADLKAQITEEKIEHDCIDITYPQVALNNKSVQREINNLIKRQINFLIPREGCSVYGQIFGKYRAGVNKNGVLSLVIEFYTIRKQAANGLNVQKSVTVNLETGEVYELHDLFKRTSNYRIVLNKIIKEQIKEKNLHLIKEFQSITDDQDYYLTDNALVIYFQELEYTIHAEGIPEFVIPYTQISNLISLTAAKTPASTGGS